MKTYFIIIFLVIINLVHGIEVEFVSTKANKINVRSGPAITYPAIYQIIRKYEPLKVIRKYDDWVLIEDVDRDTGWISNSLLSNQNFVIILGGEMQNLYSKQKTSSRVVAKIEPKVRCKLIKCITQFCNISCEKSKGWIDKAVLWGV